MKTQRPGLRRLLEYARPHRRTVVLATAYSILNKILDLAPPLLIGAAVDVVVKREDSWVARFGFPEVESQLWILVIGTLIIWGLESLFEYLYSVQWRNLAQTVQHELRQDGYGHLQQLDLAFFEDSSTGGLMSILNDDINQLERFLDGGANDLLQVGTTVVVIGAIFFTLAPEVAAFAFLPMPFVLWGSFVFQKKLAPRYTVVRERVGLLNGLLSNNLSGIATIKSFTSESYEAGRVEEESGQYREANRRAIQLSSAFSPLIRMVIVMGFVFTLLLGGRAVMAGTLAVGAYSIMVFLTQRLLWPLTRLGQTVDLYQRAMASTHRVLDLLEIPIHVESGDQPLPKPVKGDVRFENVSFAYKNGIPVLKDVDLHAPAGQTIALVGATGSGKSSIVKLLLRFYEPQSGRITVDGLPIHEARLEELRGAIGLVSQDVFLFHGTVRENIAYGTFTATDDEIVTAAKAAEAHEFILELPDGYDTIVGERGQKLSGGQRQRISIARAVLKNPPILVLDEATSAVDNETEAAIQRSLARISRGRTAVVIAHRLSTIRHAYRTYVLDRGRVVETGTHDDLVEKDGVYAALWKVQTGEAEIQV
ncbi:MAG: ABC transporter ATP-binding protein [Candidatus Eisenbacteria bacterium]|nr:ABC transporter ATP-binding protein [Candidatus Eisenbacteria bacterium]